MRHIKNTPVLYWFGLVDEDGHITYHVMFEGEEGTIEGEEFSIACSNCKSQNFYVVNLN